MSRSLIGFLLFLLALSTGVGIIAWWVGPASVSLALDEERRASPYYLVHLLGGDASGADVTGGYFERFGPLLREEQGQLLWRGGLAALHAGGRADEYRDVALISFSAGADVLQMLTSVSFRELAEGVAPLMLGSTVAPEPVAQDETLMLWLLEVAADADGDALATMGDSAAGYQGQVVWSTAVDVLAGTARWNYVLLIAFPTAEQANAWLMDPETATLRALTRRHFLDDALLELRSG